MNTHSCLISTAIIILLPLALVAQSVSPLPPDSAYVRATDDGNLELNGEKVRFWAAIGRIATKTRVRSSDSAEVAAAKRASIIRENKLLVQRLQDQGFNAVRYWVRGTITDDYVKGDGSNTDVIDHYIYELKQAGMKIWLAEPNYFEHFSSDDVDIIDDPVTAEQWSAAVAEWADKQNSAKRKAKLNKAKQRRLKEGRVRFHNCLASIWDDRIEALAIERMRQKLTHVNKYTGLSWADDPVFAVWELTNEEWWMRRTLSGWKRLPQFFRNSLIAKWNDYLISKYKTDEALIAAWGDLLPGESIKQRSILFTPTKGKTPVSISLNDGGSVIESLAQQKDTVYGREDFAVQRGADVLEFMTGIWLAHKQRVGAALKSWGKSCTLSPLVYDTGIGYSVQSQFIQQSADATAHDAYVNGWSDHDNTVTLDEKLAGLSAHQQKRIRLEHERTAANTDDDWWINWLLKPPGICAGVPWLEHNRTTNKPYLVYETQIQQPAKYRSDFPMRIAVLSGIQDWDWVSWHYTAPADDTKDDVERPWDKPMDVKLGRHPQGYHFTYDEVQVSAMRAAAKIFLNKHLAPAPTPTHYIYGRESLYNPDSMDYGGAYGATGMNMLQTVYQHGVRITIDPNREKDEVIGPQVTFEQRNTFNPYTPTDQIAIDWKRGYMKFDAPGVATFTGLLGNYGDRVEFNNGVTLSDVHIHNPANTPHPMSNDDKYVTFSIQSETPQNLADSNHIGISLVSSSFNTGFKMWHSYKKHVPSGALQGTLPVLVSRVSGTVQADFLKGKNYTFRDWHMFDIGSGVIEGDTLTIPADKPIFYIEVHNKE